MGGGDNCSRQGGAGQRQQRGGTVSCAQLPQLPIYKYARLAPAYDPGMHCSMSTFRWHSQLTISGGRLEVELTARRTVVTASRSSSEIGKFATDAIMFPVEGCNTVKYTWVKKIRQQIELVLAAGPGSMILCGTPIACTWSATNTCLCPARLHACTGIHSHGYADCT